MKKLASVAVLASLTMLVGCVPCLRAIYTEKELVFKPDLIGLWSQKDSEETWQFAKAGKKAYRVVHTDREGKQGTFAGHLVELDGALFLDLYPKEPKLPQNDFYKAYIARLHTFLLVRQITPTLQMASMDMEWLDAQVRKDPKAIRHELVDRRVLLTASTKELQQFLVKHHKTPEAFGEPSNMVRQEPKQ